MALLWAALSGIVVGMGYGFRSDIFILLPIGIVTLAVGLGLNGWRVGIAAITVFVASAYLLASPMRTASSGSFGTLIMQGLSDPFQDYLDLGSAPYSFGARYSDELVMSSIAADLRPTDQGWDQREGKLG